MQQSQPQNGVPRHSALDAALRKQLLIRRDRLREVLPGVSDPVPLAELLHQVEAALERMAAGSFGFCETCHDEIEHDRLLVDPLCRNCLEHLSPREQRALERDLDLAFQVQQGLLPKTCAVAEGWEIAFHYQPAGPVSGDFCDLIRFEDGSGLFLLGDVMGKGVAASLLTAHLHAIFRSLASPTRPLPELMTQANRLFCEGTLSSFFATLVVGRIEPRGQIEVCNAGHCPPLHLHAGTSTAFESTGLPLGLFCDAAYAASRKQIAPGERLLVFSDGLPETFNQTGEAFETERLPLLLAASVDLPPEQLLARILEDLTPFRGGAPLADDLTIMVLRRRT